MLISNMELIPGRRVVEHLGLVQGSSVRAKHVGRDIMAGLKNIFGGELKGYTELLQESREEAMQRLQQQAEAVGANAILNVTSDTYLIWIILLGVFIVFVIFIIFIVFILIISTMLITFIIRILILIIKINV